MLNLGFDRADMRFMFSMWRINLTDRYLGSAFGATWAILNPLMMFALFTFVFGFVFKARLPGAETTLGYAIWLICGYGPWLATTEAITATSQSIIANAGLVKNMAFKTEILPISSALLGIVPLGVSLTFLFVLQAFNGDGWSIHALWLPVIITVQFFFLIGIGLMIAAITTFLRDFGILLPNLLMIVLFATPIFYSVSAMPEIVKTFTNLNPIYIICDSYRAVLMRHEVPPLVSLLSLAIASWVILIFNLTIFRRVKGFFPAVI